jgi:hypothetical protein
MCEIDALPLKDHFDVERFFDDTNGSELDPTLVAKGCADELKRFGEMDVYEVVPRSFAKKSKIIRTRWVRVNKGSRPAPIVKCRLVAMEFATTVRDDLFAGTPPLFALRLLTSLTASKSDHKIMILDVKCAFLYGDIRREVFIELPPEDPRSRTGDLIGRLKKAMYGTRDAPQIWGELVTEIMIELGFYESLLHPGLYYHASRGIRVMTHVDDFFCSGTQLELEWLANELEKKFELKKQVIGGDRGDQKTATFLNRTITWTPDGYQLSGDEKHVKLLLEEWGMETCKSLDNPIASKPEAGGQSCSRAPSGEHAGAIDCQSESTYEETDDPRKPMDSNDAWKFRRGAARVNYMAQDRVDLAVAAQRLSQCMARPCEGDELALKRVIRYLKGHPSCSMLFAYQGDKAPMTIMTDSDWAGDAATRKSTSGGIIRINSHIISFWCKSQATVALSSGEAELNAMVKGCSEGIGVLELMRELGCDTNVYSIETDSSAARGTVMRHGAGRMKHLSTKQLWIQGAVKHYNITPVKICRSVNSADVLTHNCTTKEFDNHLERLGLMR